MYQIGNHLIPDRIAGSLARYVLGRVPTGSFTEAVLRNDLTEAVGHADEEVKLHFFDIAAVVYNHVPVGARRANVDEWLQGRGSDDPDTKRLDEQVHRHYARHWEAALNL